MEYYFITLHTAKVFRGGPAFLTDHFFNISHVAGFVDRDIKRDILPPGLTARLGHMWNNAAPHHIQPSK